MHELWKHEHNAKGGEVGLNGAKILVISLHHTFFPFPPNNIELDITSDSGILLIYLVEFIDSADFKRDFRPHGNFLNLS